MTRKKEERWIMSDPDLLRQMCDMRDVVQKLRIGMNNRVKAIESGRDPAPSSTLSIIKRYREQFVDMEKETEHIIGELSQDYEIIKRMTNVKGIGFILAAKVVSLIDISKAKNVSSLWRYAGYGVDENGNADRLKKGQKSKSNRRLRVVCFVVASSFLKTKSPYSEIYYSAREYYEKNRSDWSKMHIHLAAQRKMMKIFLQHLWVTWRSIEGLDTNKPFVHDILNHTNYKKPDEYGWEQ